MLSLSFHRYLRMTACLAALALAACGSPGAILGTGSTIAPLAPTVTGVMPAANAIDVATNLDRATAIFNLPLRPPAEATFTLDCAAPCSAPGGILSLDLTSSKVTLAFLPGTTLIADTQYSVTVGGLRALGTGAEMATSYTWQFTTGALFDTAVPSVSSTTPGAGDVGVATNARVAAGFSEKMNPLSITDTTFTLSCPAGTPIPGSVAFTASQDVATFTPEAALPISTTCTANIGAGAADLAGNHLTSAHRWAFTTGVAADLTPPTVSSTNPDDSDRNVATNHLITATFSEPMDPVSITGAVFTLACAGAGSITGSVGYAVSGRLATFTPASTLPPEEVCTASVSAGAADVAGNPMLAARTWTFMTGATPDVTAPSVSATSPASGATAVALNDLISASFSEAINPLTVTSATFTLACPSGSPVSGTIGYAVTGNVATFTPGAPLPAGVLCTARIAAEIKDVAGNALSGPHAWSFTTGLAPDTTRPTVSATSPAANATAVAINSLITATFSEAMDALTITDATFRLACPAGTPIAGTVGYSVSGNLATLSPGGLLPASTICAATVSPAVEDGAGNALQGAVTWTFSTGVAPDTTAPTVSSTSPASNDSGVALNTSVAASFSEPMNALTITTATFTVACPAGSPITGSIGYASTGNVATFTPTGLLPPVTICSARLTTEIRDVASNALASAASWNFTTGATPDVTAPTVSATAPAPNETNVAINSTVTATFSEPMDALTVDSASFTVACPAGTPVAGTVAYSVSGNVATLTPAAALPASTLCAATVTTAITDPAGNALVSARNWTFTTGLVPDTTPPTTTFTNPGNAAVGVCINKTINATFSEPMDPQTITTASFTLAQTAGGSVAGVVAYDSNTRIATFNPTADLLGTPATNYTATIKGSPAGVRDLAGNLLTADLVTTFTTNASTCATAPVLGAAAPFGGVGGIATLTNDGVNTVINGDIGVGAASTSVTGLHEASGVSFTTTLLNNGVVNGHVYTANTPTGPLAGVAVAQALLDAQAAFASISPGVLAGGINMADTAQCPSCGGGAGDELAGRTLPPGIYLSSVGTFDLSGASRPIGNLTLDAAGDANAVWIFQTTAGTGTLNVGVTGPASPTTPINVLLINGARSKNVFWYVPGGATVGTGSTVVGTILSTAAITFSTTGTAPLPVLTTLHGRAIALTAAVTMANTVINVPAP